MWSPDSILTFLDVLIMLISSFPLLILESHFFLSVQNIPFLSLVLGQAHG